MSWKVSSSASSNSGTNAATHYNSTSKQNSMSKQQQSPRKLKVVATTSTFTTVYSVISDKLLLIASLQSKLMNLMTYGMLLNMHENNLTY